MEPEAFYDDDNDDYEYRDDGMEAYGGAVAERERRGYSGGYIGDTVGYEGETAGASGYTPDSVSDARRLGPAELQKSIEVIDWAVHKTLHFNCYVMLIFMSLPH